MWLEHSGLFAYRYTFQNIRTLITEIERQAIKSSNVTLELDAEDVCTDFKSCSKNAMYTEKFFITFARNSLFFGSFSSGIVETVLVFPSFSSPVGFQSPHLGKSFGTGGMSLSSPTLKINAIPISAWNSMWQWNSQYPEEYWTARFNVSFLFFLFLLFILMLL